MAVLGPGDLALVGYDTAGFYPPQDNFSIVALRELDAGTTFFVNDNEISTPGGNAFTDLAETEAQFTVKTGQTIPAGTVINLPWGAAAVSTATYDWSDTTGAGLGNGNDELYFYNAAVISLATATNFITFGQLGSSVGNVPNGLTLGTNAVDTTGTASRYKIIGTTYAGTKSELSTAIGNAATNWESITPTQTTTLNSSNWNFNVNRGATTPILDQPSYSFFVPENSISIPGNAVSWIAKISSDGRYVSFESDASNLVAGDNNGTSDVFVKDLQTGVITLVSSSSSGIQGNMASRSPSISSDGRYVSFESDASNLGAGIISSGQGVFIKDLQTGVTTFVSSSSSGIQGNGPSFSFGSGISSDGRYVSFQSGASDLVSGDTNETSDIFVKDVQTALTTLVSSDSSGIEGNAGSEVSTSISSDGRYVSFASSASNLVAGDNNGTIDVFVKDLQTGVTTLVSSSSSGIQGNSDSSHPSISSDGRYVSFMSEASNLVAGDIDGTSDIFVKDLQAGVTTLASSSSSGIRGNAHSVYSSISADGRYVSFRSLSSNLVANDANGTGDIFVKDLQSGETTLVSSGSSDLPSISADGRYVSFVSEASNLVAGDSNGAGDIFVKDLQSGLTTLVSGRPVGVGLVSATDPNARTSLTYSLSGTGSGNFVMNSVTGAITVAAGATLDFETNPTFVLTATVSDGSLTTTVPVTITLTNVNEAPTDIALSSNSIAANAGANATVGTLSTVDPDAGNTFAYTLVSGAGADDNAAFNISGSTLRANASFDFETKSSYTVRVRSTDQGGLSTEKAFTIAVTNVNETPTFGQLSYLFSFAENSAGTTGGNGSSFSPSISSDGRYVSFGSQASNLVAGDPNGREDIFVKDLQTGAVTLVSASSSGTLSNGYSNNPSISSDGRYVAFQSDASNLVADVTFISEDVFVKDLQTGSLTLVSASSSGAPGNDYSVDPSISADGRYVSFSSYASNLVAGDTNGTRDVFVKDLQTGAITQVSASSSGTMGNSGSERSNISSDGRYVSFVSYASNLVANDTNGTADIFVKDLQTGALTLVSTSSSGIGNDESDRPSISSDGRFVSFASIASNLAANDPNRSIDIFVKDLQTGALTLVSASSSGTLGNSQSYYPRISSDGRYVTFESSASNLVANVTTTTRNIFLKDLQTAALTLVSTNSSGIQGSGWSARPSISSDGRYVSFHSLASNLVQGDTNEAYDIFVKDLQTGAVKLVSATAAAVGAVNATDPDSTSNLTYSLSGTGSSNFVMNSATGAITVAAGAVLDFETTPTFVLIATVSDGSLTTSVPVTISLTNVNETPTDIALSSNSIAENAGANATVGTLSTVDPDAGNTFAYTLVSGAGSDDNAAFNISGSTLRANASFDFETKSSYTVRVRSTDQGGLSTDKTFTINVTSVNEAPTDIALSSNSIAENAGANATVGTLSTVDPDAGNTFTYTLVSGTGADDNGAFNISGSTLRANASSDFETKSSYTVRVRSTDQGGLTTEKAFTIAVTNVNEVPAFDQASYSFSIAENSPGYMQRNSDPYHPGISSDGRYVSFESDSRIYVKDMQTGALTIASASSSGIPGNSFSGDPSISTSGRYVSFRSHASNLVAGVTDSQSHIYVKDLQTGAIALASASSSGIPSDGWSGFIPSISADGRYVSFRSHASNLVEGVNVGGGWSASYAYLKDLQTGDVTLVSPDSTSNNPRISADGRYVTFTSDSGIFVKGVQTGVVTRVPTPGNNGGGDPMISSDGRYISYRGYEFSGGTWQLRIYVTDMQTGAITLVSANSPTFYTSISSDGRYVSFESGSHIYVKALQTGVETLISANSSGTPGNGVSSDPVISSDGRHVSFRSQASNLVPGDTNETGDIFVKDLHTGAVTLVSATGITVGVVNATDPDNTSNLSYSLSGTGSSNFVMNSATGAITVAGGAILDFETTPTFVLTATVSDGSLSATVPVTITLTNVNEAPTDIALSSNSIAENAGANATVGTFSTVDPDAGNTFAYTLVSGAGSDDNAAFNISGSTLRANASIDFETKSSYTVRVRSTDQGGLITEKAFTIAVTNVSESLSFDQASYLFSIAEGSAGFIQANSQSYFSRVSSDGRYVSFISAASNLVPGDTNGMEDIFVKDLQTGAITLVSASSSGTLANNFSREPSISSDGRYVSFTSLASNLIAGDTNRSYDVFVKDLQTGALRLVSTSTSGTLGNGLSESPSISSDGRYVSFSSYARNLVPGDTNGTSDIFLKDLQTGAITLVSASSSGTLGNLDSHGPSISSDGRYVAFHSAATNLVAGDTNGEFDIFVKDLQTGGITLVSTSSSGTLGNDHSGSGQISSDGRYVSFSSYASNWVAGNTNRTINSFVKDLQTGVLTVLSESTSGTLGNGDSFSAQISSDGRYVVFQSYASNLVTGDTNGTSDIFLKNLQTGSLTLVSASSMGTLGNNHSIGSSISSDGRYISLDSSASNLVAGDTNGEFDIFLKDLQTGAVTLVSSTGTAVGLVNATDPDGTSNLSYSLSGTGSSNFVMNSATGAITVATGAILDFETTPTFVLTATVSDGSLTTSVPVTITLTNVNEAPTDITLSSSTVGSNAPAGTTVGTLTTTDPDAANTFTYSLTGADAGKFVVVAGALQVGSTALDGVQSSYSISITSTDQGGLSFTKAFTIGTTAASNVAPTNILLSNSSIAENSLVGTTVGTLSAVDANPGDTATFSLPAGLVDNASFTIVGTALRSNTALDFETKASYSVTVRVADGGGLTFDKTFTISVTNVNEAPTAILLSNRTIAENAGTNVFIGTLTASDPDAGSLLNFSLPVGGQDDNAAFNISGASLRANASFDFETKNSYLVNVRVTDAGGLTFDNALIVEVTNVNEAPVFSAASYNFTIAENSAAGTSVGSVSATDPEGSLLAYGRDGMGVSNFTLFGTGLITVGAGASLNFEATPTFVQEIYVLEFPFTFGSLRTAVPVTITLTDVNEAPTDILLSDNRILDNATANTVVGTVSTVDDDAGNTFTYALSGADAAAFTLVGTTLQSTAAYDGSQASYSISITSTDNTGLSFTKAFTIQRVASPNRAPANIVLSATNVAENSAVGTTVGTLQAVDPDTNNTFTFELVSGAGSTNNAAFSISGTSLNLAAVPNFEANSSYSIRVRVTDQGGLSFDRIFTINVTNVNEAPTDINLSSSTVVINAPAGTVVGSLSTVDPEAGSTFTYELSGADASKFTIVGNSLRVGATALNGTTTSYSLSITSSDGSLSYTEAFTIGTVAAPNTAPTNILLSNNTIAENSAIGSLVGTLSATDDQSIGHSFALVSGAGSTNNASFAISGTSLNLATIPNFEANSSYSARIRVTDAGGLSYDRIFTINITNVNEAPTDISLSGSNTVVRNAAAGTVVGTLSTIDPDAGSVFSYSLSGADASKFTIVGSSLRTAVALDGIQTSYSISITSSDGVLTYSEAFTIGTVAAPNTAPTNITLSTNSVPENTASGTLLATLGAVDANQASGHTFTLVSGAGSTDNGSFAIVGTSLNLATVPNFEAKSSYSIRVRVTDAGGLSFEKVFSINVTNVNEAPTNLNLSNSTVAINAAIGTVVGNLSTVDPDSGNTFSYVVGGADASRFIVVGSSLRVGATALDGTTTSYSITVTTTDQGGLTFTKAFTIGTVAAPNTPPTNITLSSTTIVQNSPAGTVLGTLGAIDANQTTGFKFELVSGAGSTDNATFDIVNGQLVLKSSIPSRATKASYVVRIRVTDAAGLSFDKVFGIYVTA